MDKEMLKKSRTWEEVKAEMNFTKEDLRLIRAEVKLYRLLDAFREEKRKRSLTNKKISELSSIPRPEVSKILNGKTNVSLLRLQALANAFEKEIEIKLK